MEERQKIVITVRKKGSKKKQSIIIIIIIIKTIASTADRPDLEGYETPKKVSNQARTGSLGMDNIRRSKVARGLLQLQCTS